MNLYATEEDVEKMIDKETKKTLNGVVSYMMDKVDFTLTVSFENGKVVYILFDPEVKHYETEADETT